MSQRWRRLLVGLVSFFTLINFAMLQIRLRQPAPFYGFIDKHGRYVIQPQFSDASSFSEGLAVVEKGVPVKRGYINRSGHAQFPFKFGSADSFSEGRACVSVLNNQHYGYIDRHGVMVIPANYMYPAQFSGRVASVCKEEWEDEYIDRTGKPVVVGSTWTSDSKQSLAPVESSANRWGYIDVNGKLVIPCKFDEAQPFINSFARVSRTISAGSRYVNPPTQMGFIDSSGTLLGDRWYDDCHDFSEGLAAVLVGNKWGFVDQTGRMVIPPQFDHVESFHEGLCCYDVNGLGGPLRSDDDGLWGYIDRKGSVVIKPKFRQTDSFSEGLAAVSVADGGMKWGFIDRTGRFVIKPRFGFAKRFSEGLAPVRKPFKSPWWLW